MNVLFDQALAIAIVAYVYAEILTQPQELFHWWLKFLRSGLCEATEYRELNGLPDDREVFAPNGRKLEDYWFIYNPIVGCFKCVAGQLAMWWYFITTVVYGMGAYRLDYHITLISASIILSITIKHLHEWMKRNM